MNADAEKDKTQVNTDEMDELDHYEYYKYISGGDKPDVGIRVYIDKNGYERLAETADPETGQYRNSYGWFGNIWDGPYCEESTEEEFNQLNTERMAWVKRKKQQKPDTGSGPS